ncbi:hypothetical protein AUJ14_03805 [Candidatus Micrarchaeota archaeon CG1_02_55_22]|nr:MAG: hypothetical protein AUJ14_03805 [Candidatus Micrarchaeota archaeon CG1_02_55_22]
MNQLKATALLEGKNLGVRPSITDYADASEGVAGFRVHLQGANINLAKEVHAAVQQQAIDEGLAIQTKLYPGEIRVYWKV